MNDELEKLRPEAREKAVPVAWMHFYRKKGGGTRMWFPTLVPKAEPQDGYEWVETRPLQENVRQTPPDAERLAEALRNARGFVRHFGDEPARVCIAEIDAALAAHSAQAQPPAASVPDAETLRLHLGELTPDEVCVAKAAYRLALAAQENPNG